MLDLDLLPRLPSRPLSEAEARGFLFACTCLITMGRQMERAPSLPGVPGWEQEAGRRMRACAAGLAVTLGQARTEPV